MNDAEEKAREERIRSLELAIEEQRKDYEVLQHLYQGVKNTTAIKLAASLATLTYLYASTSGDTLQQRLFIPSEPYGIIFYAFGLVLLLFGIATLLLSFAKSMQWSTAYDNEQEESLILDYEKYLHYMRKRYLKVSRTNAATYERRFVLVSMSFLPLVLGAIILLVLKTFGGQP